MLYLEAALHHGHQPGSGGLPAHRIWQIRVAALCDSAVCATLLYCYYSLIEALGRAVTGS